MQGTPAGCRIRVCVTGRGRGARREGGAWGYASVHFGLLLAALKRARLWSRVAELHCSCERWLGPVRVPFQ